MGLWITENGPTFQISVNYPIVMKIDSSIGDLSGVLDYHTLCKWTADKFKLLIQTSTWKSHDYNMHA